MIEQYVKANSLSCVLNENCSAEKIPEPFRMQGTVSFRVTYQEYVKYILSLPDKSLIVLMADISFLRTLATTNNPKLYSYFLKDLAFAICKEVWFAEAYDRDASIILPASLSSEPIGVSKYLDSYELYSYIQVELINKVIGRGFPLNTIKRTHNLVLFKIAVVIYFCSGVESLFDELNLIYDLMG